jgi:hypothetical protein
LCDNGTNDIRQSTSVQIVCCACSGRAHYAH